MPTIAQLKAEIEKIPRQSGYTHHPVNCPFHNSWQGKMFVGNLLFLDSPITYQVYECPACGKRDAIERTSIEIDADDPRYVKGAIPLTDWKLRRGIKQEAITEGKVLFRANGEMVEI